MAGATVKITGIEKAMAALEKTKQANLLPKIVATQIVAGVKANFDRGVDPDTGKKWEPVKGRSKRKPPPYQPLLDTNRLRRSIHEETRGAGYNATIAIGTNVIYAATHQFGDPDRKPSTAPFLVFEVMGHVVRARKVSIPQRKFLPTTTRGLNRVTGGKLAATVEAYIQNFWKG